MIGQISASNQLRTSSELAPNMFGASSELASVMEFGFYQRDRVANWCMWEYKRSTVDATIAIYFRDAL